MRWGQEDQVRTGERLKAALFIPPTVEADRWVHACTSLAQMNDWHVASLVQNWDDLWELMSGGLIDVAITGTHAHLPPDRLPRVEIVDEYRSPPTAGPRRPRRLWSPSGAGPPRPQ